MDTSSTNFIQKPPLAFRRAEYLKNLRLLQK
jgi:hypothetical protein